MTDSTAKLLSAALQLPAEERLQFADALWSSIDDFVIEPENDDQLHDLLRQRCEELDSGQVAELAHDEVMAELNEALERCASATTRPSKES
ncbi:MAG TPA: addiction module protein [Planctomycetaceae bacterium]|nr:addiction module protein [Planctomycetaceae bacterium]